MTRNIVVISAALAKSYSGVIAGLYNERQNGTATVIEPQSLYETLPDHEAILVRFALAKENPIYEALTAHVHEHGCVCINRPSVMTKTADKYESNEIVKGFMKAPKTETYEGDNVPTDFRFPAVIKPRYSSGGRGITFVQTQRDLEDFTRNEEQDVPLIIQEAVDFTKLIRLVWVSGYGIRDALYDVPTSQYTIRVKLGRRSRIYSDRDGLRELNEVCARVAHNIHAHYLIPDIFDTADGFVFNELNTACKLYWLTAHSGIRHALFFADYMRSVA